MGDYSQSIYETKLRSQLVFRDSVISCRKGESHREARLYTNREIKIHVYAGVEMFPDSLPVSGDR